MLAKDTQYKCFETASTQFMRYSLIFIAICCGTCPALGAAEAAADGDEPQNVVASALTDIERHLSAFKMEVMQWETMEDEVLFSSSRFLLRSRDRFYETIFEIDSDEQESVYRLSSFDGKTYTSVIPGVTVEQQTDARPMDRMSSVFTPMLAEVGLRMTLSEFFSTESSLVDISVSCIAESDSVLALNRTTGPPGRPPNQSVVFRVAKGEPIRPLSFEQRNLSDGTTIGKIHVTAWDWNGSSLSYSLATDQTRTEPPVKSRIVCVECQFYTPSIAGTEFQIHAFKGNPRVDKNSSGRLVDSAPYHPEIVDFENPTPPWIMWLLINDVLVVATILVTSCIYLVRRVRRNTPGAS